MSEELRKRIEKLDAEISDKEMERDRCIDEEEGDLADDLQLEIEALNADLKSLKKQLELSGT